jgi:vesicle coat complex subunit
MYDRNGFIRENALSVIENLSDTERKAIYEQVKAMALHDKVSQVRAAAVQSLDKYFRSADNRDVFAKTAKDKSPLVLRVTEALKN